MGLTVPFLDRRKGSFPREVKKKENGNCITTYERQHIHKFSLATEIPKRKFDIGFFKSNSFFHEINAKIFDIIGIKLV